jgi:hypothetical protein
MATYLGTQDVEELQKMLDTYASGAADEKADLHRYTESSSDRQANGAALACFLGLQKAGGHGTARRASVACSQESPFGNYSGDLAEYAYGATEAKEHSSKALKRASITAYNTASKNKVKNKWWNQKKDIVNGEDGVAVPEWNKPKHIWQPAVPNAVQSASLPIPAAA